MVRTYIYIPTIKYQSVFDTLLIQLHREKITRCNVSLAQYARVGHEVIEKFALICLSNIQQTVKSTI